MVDEPTRGQNFLDLIITSEEDLITSVLVGEPFETNDHQMIRFELVGRRSTDNNLETNYNYFKADYGRIKPCMQDIQCVATEDGKGVDSYWNSIKDKLMEIRDKFIPKYKKKRNKCKWVTKEVEKRRKEKTKAWNNYIKSGRNHLLFEIYKSKLRLSVRENANAKRIFEEKLANNIKEDSKSFYSYVRSKQRTKGGVGPLISQAGETVLDDKIAANMMNEYFASVFTVEDISNIPEPIKLFDSMLEI